MHPKVYPGSLVHYLQIWDTTTIQSHPHKTPARNLLNKEGILDQKEITIGYLSWDLSSIIDATREIHGVQEALFIKAKYCRQVHRQSIEWLNKLGASILWNITQLLKKEWCEFYIWYARMPKIYYWVKKGKL